MGNSLENAKLRKLWTVMLEDLLQICKSQATQVIEITPRKEAHSSVLYWNGALQKIKIWGDSVQDQRYMTGTYLLAALIRQPS